MKIGDRCFVHGYVDEIRKDVVIIKNKGGYFGTDPGEVITVTDTNVGDLINRQAAIDIERNATVDTNPSHFEAHQKFTQFMDDAEISSFGRWQWSNGFNTALTAVGIDLKKLPSAQPEIVRCKDCKHFWLGQCGLNGLTWSYDSFCSMAERREE